MYLRVNLHIYNSHNMKVQKKFSIHRLVAIAFIPNPENKPEVNHVDGDIMNNKLSNLEWMTTIENIKHACDNNLRHPRYGINHHAVFWNINDIHLICKCIEKSIPVNESFELVKDLLSVNNCKYSTFRISFYNIKQKRSWRNISKKYNF